MENLIKEELVQYFDKFEKTMEEIKKDSSIILEKIENLTVSDIDQKLIKCKTRAAEIADCSAQNITKLLNEGRLTNYGAGGRDYRFKYAELLDLRELKDGKD